MMTRRRMTRRTPPWTDSNDQADDREISNASNDRASASINTPMTRRTTTDPGGRLRPPAAQVTFCRGVHAHQCAQDTLRIVPAGSSPKSRKELKEEEGSRTSGSCCRGQPWHDQEATACPLVAM